MPFLEEQFPPNVSFGLQAGPEFVTDVIITRSGKEQRNQIWSVPRNNYVFNAKKSRDLDMQTLLDFMRGVAFGMFNGFRLKDWEDYNSLTPTQTITKDDVVIGTGDGVKTVFQVVKLYTFGAQTFSRNIVKLVSGTILVAKNTVLQADPGDYTVDINTGKITFVAAPAGGDTITAGYEFDVAARFDVDIQTILATSNDIFQWTNIKLKELKL